MRTIEEFTKNASEENRKYNEALLNLSPAELINRACEIAKWQTINDYIVEKVIPYLEDGDDVFKDFLTLEIDYPIAMIFECELNCNEPMWTTWDALDEVVMDMFRIIKN